MRHSPNNRRAGAAITVGEKPRARAPLTRYMPAENLDKIGETAVYYGFTPLKSPAITKADHEAARGIMADDFVDDETEGHGKLPLRVEEKIALVRTYHEQDWASQPQPVSIYLKDPCKAAYKPASGAIGKGAVHRYADLEILGASGPIAEATLIQTAVAMLSEEGYTDAAVEVNSVGDRDSMTRFGRELSAYYRKKIDGMTPECRQLLKKSPFDLLSSRDPECAELNAAAPKSMDFLSETSRRHLEEVLEYLETLGIRYSINNGLMGNRSYSAETVFAIIDKSSDNGNKGQRVLALGMRYNGLSKRLGMKRDIQGVGLSLLIRNGSKALREPLRRIKRPIASFVQLGIESKLMSLDVVEKLRKVGIPLYLSLAKDRLGAQVGAIEKHHAPYAIVIGKKEAVEKTAIVRKMDDYSQETVPMDKLCDYMKKAEKAYWSK